MHTQCPKEQVLRLPSSTRSELNAKEVVEDRQLLLNEEWPVYAAKQGAVETASRVKSSTESWAAFENRKKKQQVFFELHERQVEQEVARNETARQSLQKRSDAVIETMMAFDRNCLSKRTAPQHSLFVDFYKYQLQLFSQQKTALGEMETMIRAKLEEDESELMFSIVSMWHADNRLQRIRHHERMREERAMQQQMEQMERQRAKEAEQREIERIAKERQDAEDEKERAEAEKRAERKRREEERRAKARVEREQRMSRDGPTENA